MSRDRASSDADAARQGAPQARQGADRFHRIKNMREKLTELLDRKRACLPWKEEKAEAIRVASPSYLQQQDRAQKEHAMRKPGRRKKASQGHSISELSTTHRANERRRALNREKRYERYEAVKALRAQGLSH